VIVNVPSSATQDGSSLVVSMATGATLSVTPGSGIDTGYALSHAAAGDVNGDGVPDFAVGAPFEDSGGTDAGCVTVISGTGHVLRRITGSAATDLAGWSVAGPGDLDGDGLGDLFIGAPYAESPLANGGVATAWSQLGPWTSLGFALGGSAGEPALGAASTLLPGTPLTVSLQSAAPDAPVFAVLGLSGQAAPFKGGILVPAPDAVFAGLVTGDGGELLIAETWPAEAPPGLKIWIQCWVLDAAGPVGFAASNALKGEAP
jgi:hypothetical protein